MRWVIVLLVLLAGCPGPEGDDMPTPDTPDGGSTVLHLAWAADPVVPGPVGSGVVVERARFVLENLRVVGDAGPGDPRTSLTDLTLEWRETEAPDLVDFPEAPSGIYSRVLFDIDDGEAVEIRGTAEIEGTPVPFTVTDLGELAVSIEINLDLPPGEERTQTIDVDLGRVLDAIDFQALPIIENRRVLREGDPQLEEARTKLRESFTDGTGSSEL